MRQERIIQASLFDIFATHEIGRELKQISEWLDQHRALLRLVGSDLRRDGLRETGRRGLPAETVLRCALLKQHRQLSYEELGVSPGRFGIVSRLCTRATGVVAEEVGAAADHQRDHRGDLGGGQSGAGAQRWQTRAGDGSGGTDRQHRHAALMHEPSDSALLWDAVRVMSRLLDQATELPGAPRSAGVTDRRWPSAARLRSNTAAARSAAPAVPQADRRHPCHPPALQRAPPGSPA